MNLSQDRLCNEYIKIIPETNLKLLNKNNQFLIQEFVLPRRTLTYYIFQIELNILSQHTDRYYEMERVPTQWEARKINTN
jgi:hypothetical protein